MSKSLTNSQQTAIETVVKMVEHEILTTFECHIKHISSLDNDSCCSYILDVMLENLAERLIEKRNHTITKSTLENGDTPK